MDIPSRMCPSNEYQEGLVSHVQKADHHHYIKLFDSRDLFVTRPSIMQYVCYAAIFTISTVRPINPSLRCTLHPTNQCSREGGVLTIPPFGVPTLFC